MQVGKNSVQMTVAQVEIEIARGLNRGLSSVFVRYNPKKLSLLDRYGIAYKWVVDSNFNDVYRVSFAGVHE